MPVKSLRGHIAFRITLYDLIRLFNGLYALAYNLG
jgi:hypothetical protein